MTTESKKYQHVDYLWDDRVADQLDPVERRGLAEIDHQRAFHAGDSIVEPVAAFDAALHAFKRGLARGGGRDLRIAG